LKEYFKTCKKIHPKKSRPSKKNSISISRILKEYFKTCKKIHPKKSRPSKKNSFCIKDIQSMTVPNP